MDNMCDYQITYHTLTQYRLTYIIITRWVYSAAHIYYSNNGVQSLMED